MAAAGAHPAGNPLSALRAILRLKAGVSPSERLAEVTVQLARHTAEMRRILAEGGGAFGIVQGPYGSGKSHFLRLLRETALRSGWLVASLSLDAGPAALGHPQRHVSELLRSLELPGDPPRNALAWVRELCDAPHGLAELKALLHRLAALNADTSETGLAARALLESGRRQGDLRGFLQFMAGTDLAHKVLGPSSRSQAYGLFRFWNRLGLEMARARGFLLLIDEMENLFLPQVSPSVLVRRAAYRSLSFYLGRNLDKSAVVWAITPDGIARLLEEIEEECAVVAGQKTRLPEEDVAALRDAVKTARPYALDFLSAADCLELANRIRDLHTEARQPLSFPQWETWVQFLTRTNPTMRLFVRSVASVLESRWRQLAEEARG